MVPAEGGDRTPRLPPADGEAPAGCARLLAELLVSAPTPAANLVVLRTPPGAAQFLASALDQAGSPTSSAPSPATTPSLVIARDPDGGAALAARLLDLAERTPATYRRR